MIYVNIEECEPSQSWLNKAQELTEELLKAKESERSDIIDKNEHLWKELKQSFCDYLNRKCWYSESVNDYTHCHIDHFRPKIRAIDEDGNDQGGYWWLAFYWKNYRYSAPAGNIRKRDFFHVNNNKANQPTDSIENEDIRLLDPTDPEDPSKLIFNNLGEASPSSMDKYSRDFIRADYSIKRLNLNLTGLVEGRKDAYNRAARIIRDLEYLLPLQNENPDTARKQKISNNFKQLIELAKRKSPYSATVKTCLKDAGHQWALNIAIEA